MFCYKYRFFCALSTIQAPSGAYYVLLQIQVLLCFIYYSGSVRSLLCFVTNTGSFVLYLLFRLRQEPIMFCYKYRFFCALSTIQAPSGAYYVLLQIQVLLCFIYYSGSVRSPVFVEQHNPSNKDSVRSPLFITENF
ncbi:hypothetical protein SAMN05428988_4333 [Chitinophaga sp. YR573]|nr:hypothetical protein SAMN05428988_4333 [Chitinophaga sp. YR573]